MFASYFASCNWPTTKIDIFDSHGKQFSARFRSHRQRTQMPGDRNNVPDEVRRPRFVYFGPKPSPAQVAADMVPS
jgi:hypothetical protein